MDHPSAEECPTLSGDESRCTCGSYENRTHAHEAHCVLMQEQHDLKVGDYVLFQTELDRYPHFTVEKHNQGVVTLVTGDRVEVLAMGLIPGCEDWGNVVQFWEDTLCEVSTLGYIRPGSLGEIVRALVASVRLREEDRAVVDGALFDRLKALASTGGGGGS